MKKIYKILMISILMLTLTACGTKFYKETGTYVSTSDSKVKIKFTKEQYYLPSDKGKLSIKDSYKAYIYDGNDKFEATYAMMKTNTIHLRYNAVSFAYERGDEVIIASYDRKGKKLELRYSQGPPFTDNPEFVKQTWTKPIIIIFAITVALMFIKTMKTAKKSGKDVTATKKLK